MRVIKFIFLKMDVKLLKPKIITLSYMDPCAILYRGVVLGP